MKKLSFKPIAMRCNQEQFERVRSKLSGWMFDYAIVSLEYPYLTNYLQHGNQIATCTDFYAKNNKERHELHETWNEKIFLEACGIETIPTLEEVKEYFKNAEKVKGTYGTKGKISNCDERGIHEWLGDFWFYDNKKMNILLWDKNKGYAKILTYKEPKEETFVIDKGFLKAICQEIELNQKSAINWIKEKYPSAFVEDKKELSKDFTGWCKFDNMGNDDWIMYFKGGIQQYGIDSNEDWFIPAGIAKIKSYFREASPEEVKEALTKEAVKRGYSDRNYRCLVIPDHTHNVLDSYYMDSGNLLHGEQGQKSNVVFKDGIWAEIIPTLTIKEAEQKLNCKII